MANYLTPEDDSVNYLPARVNPNLAAQGRRYNLTERQKINPLMQAGAEQWVKEFASMKNRGAVPDLINRGLIANTAGLPVDLVNTVLQSLGLGSEQPVGGSDSIRRALEYYGLSSETQRPMLETLASLTPPRAVMGAARVAGQGAEAVGRAAAPVAGQAIENYLVRSGGILPMDVYHGSPHRFPPTAKNPLGEFDASKIGTGEGAQAYGHGLYLAAKKAVADEYAGKLSKKFVDIEGFNPGANEKSIFDRLSARANATQYGSGSSAVWDDLQSILRHGTDAEKTAAKNIENNAGFLGGKLRVSDAGSLYKVDLPDEQLATMLVWDKPLSQQPEALKTIRGLVPADMLKSFDANVKGGISGSNAYKNYIPSQSYAIRDAGATNYKPSAAKTFEDALAEVGGDTSRLRVINDRSEAKVSEMLRAQGIPGIRYLDEGSRAGGAGTSNFVVFDPKHMNIIGRE